MIFADMRPSLRSISALLATLALTSGAALAGGHDPGPGFGRDLLLITSSNDPDRNSLVVFKLALSTHPALNLTQVLLTGGKGGATGNAGIVQIQDDLGAVANFGSSTISRFVRHNDFLSINSSIALAPRCNHPDSVALNGNQLFVAGEKCAQSLRWPSGVAAGAVVPLPDTSAGQIVAGYTWAAVTLKSGSVLQLPLRQDGALSGAASSINLPAGANDTPLGAAFWEDTLGFTPAHSPDSFAVVNHDRQVFPIAGPSPAFPANATCWVAKGPGNVWYTGNSPGQAISIFFTDDQGGVFYKSVPVPGTVTDITVSPDTQWLAAIYTADGNGYVTLFSIDPHGDLTHVATSDAVGIAAFNGIAISH